LNAPLSRIVLRFLLSLSLSPGLSCSHAETNPLPPREPTKRDLAALEEELAATEALKGKDHADLVPILMNISVAQRDQGGWIPARPFAQRALEIVRKNPAAESLETAGALDLLGTLDWLQGD